MYSNCLPNFMTIGWKRMIFRVFHEISNFYVYYDFVLARANIIRVAILIGWKGHFWCTLFYMWENIYLKYPPHLQRGTHGGNDGWVERNNCRPHPFCEGGLLQWNGSRSLRCLLCCPLHHCALQKEEISLMCLLSSAFQMMKELAENRHVSYLCCLFHHNLYWSSTHQLNRILFISAVFFLLITPFLSNNPSYYIAVCIPPFHYCAIVSLSASSHSAQPSLTTCETLQTSSY